MAACPAFDPLAPYAIELVAFVDCHARNLGEFGYMSWSQGGGLGVLLGGLITILVALFGYRLLLGEALTLHELISPAVRIGVVLVLATQWPAYRVLVYDVVVLGPGQISQQLLSSDGLGASSLNRTQSVYEAVDRVVHPPNQRRTQGPGAAEGEPPGASRPLGGLTADDRKNVDWAGYVFLTTTLGGMLAVRVAAGLLLALAPLFVVGLLFDPLRGLFMGWVRALMAVALGSVAVAVGLAVELEVLEAQLRTLIAVAGSGEFIAMLPGEILLSASLFAIILTGLLVSIGWACAGLSLPHTVRLALSRVFQGIRPVPISSASTANVQPEQGRERAQALAETVLSMTRREARSLASREQQTFHQLSGATAAPGNNAQSTSYTSEPLGQSWRRTSRRHSLSERRREARA